MSIQVYGIPNCGTCKKALQWLDANGLAYQFINTKEYPPTREMIESWVKSLTAKAMRNTSGKSYRELGNEKQNWTDEQWIAAFSQDVMLVKRPLIVKDGIAVLVGFRDKEEVIRQKLDIN